MKKPQLTIITLIFLLTFPASFAHAQTETGSAYIVQTGDWLSKIAQTFYDDPKAYQQIVDATNAQIIVNAVTANEAYCQ